MKNTSGFMAVAGFLFIILLLTLGDVRNSVEDMRSRFAQSEARLAGARTEVQQLRAETATMCSRALAGLSGRNSRPDRSDPAELQRDILGPSVQVTAKGSVGGGTLLFSRETHSYVVTACHVIQKILAGSVDEETREPADVTIYDDQGASTDVMEGDLVAWDERKDLALLRLRSLHEIPNAARLASRETLRSIHVFTPIYTVGCPLGHDPLPTLGEIATLNKEVNGERFWMMNAPTIFGNSGGGVFHRETRELIGVSAMVCTYDGAVSTPVPHLGIMVSLESVYDWLDSLNYQFIYDPEYPLEAFEAVHSARAKPSFSSQGDSSQTSPTSTRR
jgi:S1-C subfamily serine protease